MSAGQPTYSTITPTKVSYTNAAGAKESTDVPLVTLPPGTVLFRGIRLPTEGQDSRAFFTEYFGSIEGQEMCLTPVHNTFFYPTPFVPFGVHTVGSQFNAIHVYITVHPIQMIAAIAPSRWSRGGEFMRAFNGGAPFQKCSNFNFPCHQETAKEIEAKAYDNCINPTYAAQSGVRGWIALANLDSLAPYKTYDEPTGASPMGEYVKGLAARRPGLAEELLTQVYTDSRKHVGFPELAVFPLRTHPGPNTVRRRCANERQAKRHLELLAEEDELNFLPIATITADGVADMVKGFYALSALPSSVGEGAQTRVDVRSGAADSVLLAGSASSVEAHLEEWLTRMKTEGLALPGHGAGTMSLDSRTGFYVFPQILPASARVKQTPYTSLLLPLRNEAEQFRALEYRILFRSFIPDKWMESFALTKEARVPRAMIFARPGSFRQWFETLGLTIPPTMAKMGARASYQHKVNTGAATMGAQPATGTVLRKAKGGAAVKKTRGRGGRTGRSASSSSHKGSLLTASAGSSGRNGIRRKTRRRSRTTTALLRRLPTFYTTLWRNSSS